MIPLSMVRAIPWGWVAIPVLVLAAYVVGYVRGGMEERIEREVEERATAALAEAVMRRNQAKTKEIRDGFIQAIDGIHVYYRKHPFVVRLRVPCPTGGVSEAPGGAVEGAGLVISGSPKVRMGWEREARTLDRVIEDCAATAARLEALQKWVREVE